MLDAGSLRMTSTDGRTLRALADIVWGIKIAVGDKGLIDLFYSLFCGERSDAATGAMILIADAIVTVDRNARTMTTNRALLPESMRQALALVMSM